jgi:hypothetical protein
LELTFFQIKVFRDKTDAGAVYIQFIIIIKSIYASRKERPMPLAIISASPIRLSAERHIDFRYKNDYELIIIE